MEATAGFLSRAEPLRASDGTLLMWVGVISTSKNSSAPRRALRESEKKFRDYAETASDWFWEIDSENKFTLLTENAFGSNAADRIGTACWDQALDLETEPEKWQLIRAALDSRQPFRDFVYRTLSGDGASIHVRSSGKPVFDADGRFRGYRGTGSDVTATMRALEEHERLHQLESDLAHMNRLSMMGELAASLAHEIAQPVKRAQQCPCGPQFSGKAAARPARGQGSAQLCRWRRRPRGSNPRPDSRLHQESAAKKGSL